MTVMSGVSSQSFERNDCCIIMLFSGLTSIPSSNTLSPLDTFLDLLTAKATLTDIDFGLLIEATETSTEEFF